MERPTVCGKFLEAGGKRLWVRGVTYGTFRADDRGDLFPRPDVVRADLSAMARQGINAVRVYAPPSRAFMDLAEAAGLRVMVGLSWPQHDCFLDIPGRTRESEHRVRAAVRALAGHPALLCHAIGNEIPSGVVRWLG